jgi:hypothetical protein
MDTFSQVLLALNSKLTGQWDQPQSSDCVLGCFMETMVIPRATPGRKEIISILATVTSNMWVPCWLECLQHDIKTHYRDENKL